MKIVRMMNPEQAQMMAGFAAWFVVGHHRGLDAYADFQQDKEWRMGWHNEVPSTFPVAVLGYGAMGQAIGNALKSMGYTVTGWAWRTRTVDGVEVLSGEAGLEQVLASAKAVVGVLPLTEATKGIFNAKTFAMMRDDAILVQLGRGGHLVEDDLIAALDQGRPAIAALDVFQTEPLPTDSPLWHNPKVRITPHIASDSDGDAIARSVMAAISDHEAGRDPAGLVDRGRGY